MRIWFSVLTVFTLLVVSCSKERPYLSGHIRRAHDAIMAPCDPYNIGKIHTCVIFSAAFRESLYVFDVTAGEMVLAPMSYFPLKIRVGSATTHLVNIKSIDPMFPFVFALDQGTVYPVRTFTSGKIRSFSQPQPQKLSATPFRLAGVDTDGKIISVSTLPNESSIELRSFDRQTGELDAAITRTIKVGTKPSHVEIDADRKVAVISDEGENSLHILDLANINSLLTKADESPKIHTISAGMPTERIYLSRRDIGYGDVLFAVVLRSAGGDIALVDIDKKSLAATMTFDEFPMAAYFPQGKNVSCCDGVKNWFGVATIKGNYVYVAIKHEQGNTTMEKAVTVDLTSESNLALSKYLVRKIIGDRIEYDQSTERENICSSHRQTIFISGYASSRSYLNVEPVEVEGHAYMCEAETGATLFGSRAE